jgi:hypothetical protein
LDEFGYFTKPLDLNGVKINILVPGPNRKPFGPLGSSMRVG